MAQYGPVSPPTCVQCLTPPREHRMPVTGYDVGPFLLAGVALIALGTIVRGRS